MKKSTKTKYGKRNYSKSIYLIICLLLSTSVIYASSQVYAEKTIFSITMNNTTVRDVFSYIESNSEFIFIYPGNKIDLDREVSISVEKKSVKEVLDKVFKGTNETYLIKDRQIIIKKTETETSEKSIPATTQQTKRTISGVVKDRTGEPLVGVSILEKGTVNGTVSDIDGKYSVNASRPDAILVFSYIGYSTQEKKIPGNNILNLTLDEDVSAISEVVVVGYGTLEKKEVTSSVSSIKNKDFISGASSSPLQAISGKVSNLSIVNNNGADPNSGISLQLRGANSIRAGQGPLIVVDGIAGANFSDIQKEDIVSIDVLKDASGAAIYGTRGSGGVILITTKQASEGKTQLNYTGEFTVESVRKKANVLSADEFVEKGLGTDYGARTNWFDEVTRDTPFTQRHAISLSSGSKNLKTYTSLYYKNAEGVAIETGRREVGGRINMNYSLWDDRLQFTGRISYSDIRAEKATNSMFMIAMKLNPTIPVYDSKNPTGYNVLLGGWEEFNPVADVRLKRDRSDYKNLMSSLSTRLKITDDLSTTFTMGIKSDGERLTQWKSAQHKESRDNNVKGSAKIEQKDINDVSLDWLFNYNKVIGKHSIKGVAGYSYQEFNLDGFYAENKDFPVDGVQWWDIGTGTYLSEGRAGMGSYKDPRERLVAFLGRVNYSYDDKYLASISARYEGISKLSPGHQWGIFPAISVGWRISEEDFMKDITWLNDLKLRLGFGRTGNADFDKGVGTRMYGADTWWLNNGVWFKTYGLAHNVNKNLKWEEKEEYNLGIDFSLIKNRLSGKIDVYKRDVNDLIYDISVPQPPAVHDKTTMNYGSLENKGFEVELTGVIVDKKDFNYTSTIKVSQNTTTLKSLWGSLTYWDRKGFEAPGSPGTAIRLIAGQKIGKYYIWKYAGIDEDGNWLLYDKDNNVIPASKKTQEDKRFLGNSIPKAIVAWENSFTYKNFDLNLFFRSWIKYDVFNKINMYYGLSNVANQNVLSEAYKKNSHITGEKELCDYWLEDGTFFKLDALNIGYTFKIPSFEKYINSIRASITARDVFCITGYSGLDPEVNTTGLEPGFEERDVYPKVRSFTAGIQINF